MPEAIARNVDVQVVNGFKGVLVIGDPLLGPHKRAGRVDNTWEAGFSKLKASFDLAAEREWLPLIIGDVLHDIRDIGHLLPLIQLLKNRRAIILPRNARWGDGTQGHLAAILQASGIASVAGSTANRFQVTMEHEGHLISMMLETHAPWGGVKRLEPGCKAKIVIPELGVSVEPSSGLPSLDGDQTGSRIEAGRLLRLSSDEQDLEVAVFSLTVDGVERHKLEVTPIVFSESAKSALERNIDLNRDSLFVSKLRASTEQELEEEGKGSLFNLVTEICGESGSDEWIEETIISLAKEAAA